VVSGQPSEKVRKTLISTNKAGNEWYMSVTPVSRGIHRKTVSPRQKTRPYLKKKRKCLEVSQNIYSLLILWVFLFVVFSLRLSQSVYTHVTQKI
jgi:hypothetical protein